MPEIEKPDAAAGDRAADRHMAAADEYEVSAMVMRDAETQYWAVEPGPRTGWQPRPLRQAEPVGEASHAPDVGDRRHTGIDGERQAWQPAPIPPYNFTPDLTQVTGPQIEEPEIGG